jgi:5-methylcytosine-specific restriction protein A
MSGQLSTQRWQHLRRAVLIRDRGVCQMHGPRCTLVATTVDHITPRAQGGSMWDPANLRAACAACNYSAGGQLVHVLREPHSQRW